MNTRSDFSQTPRQRVEPTTTIPRLVPEYIRTSEEAALLDEELAELEKKLYTSSVISLEKLLGDARASTSALLTQSLKGETAPTRDVLLKTINSLQEQLTSLPVVQITIAREPSNNTIDIIAAWFASNVGELLLTIFVNPKLIAGIQIAFKGRYKDLSLVTKIDEFLKKSLYKGQLEKQAL